ncbi:MAG: hypothetical protein KDB79_07345, partial [Acidobacteria bacterium]|nr:hypothetical protein [Acidobacteriota bacterium]
MAFELIEWGSLVLNTKTVRIFSILCFASIVIIFIEGIIRMSLGDQIFYFEPAVGSDTKALQATINFFISALLGVIDLLPMYFALLAFYFSGALGQSKWAKLLLFSVVILFIVQVLLSAGFGVSTLLRAFEIKTLENEPLRSIHDFWFIDIGRNFFRLTPFIAVCFSATALVVKRTSSSIALAPALAAFTYMFFGYAYARPQMYLPDYFSLAIFIGLTAIFFRGDLGNSIWAKLLFGSLIALFVATLSITGLVNLVYLLVQFDIGSAIPGTLLFGWFAA